MKALKPLFRISKLAFLLVFILLFSCRNDAFDEIVTVSNIRIVQVNADTDVVLIANFGGANEDISDYWLCIRKSYMQVGDLISDVSLNLANREFVTIPFPLNDISSDVALFRTDDFTSPQAMVDFMQYGGDLGEAGAVQVAINKGIWEDGTFVNNVSPYTYGGDGTQLGVTAWSGTVGQSGDVPNIRILQVDPVEGTVTLKNFGTAAQNVSNYLICNQKDYAAVAGLTSQQDLILDPDETLVLMRALPTNSSDVALYTNDAFESTNAMLDFMQYGEDVGSIGQVAVAVAKGIWTNGAFVGGSAPFDYTGDGTDIGATHWSGN